MNSMLDEMVASGFCGVEEEKIDTIKRRRLGGLTTDAIWKTSRFLHPPLSHVCLSYPTLCQRTVAGSVKARRSSRMTILVPCCRKPVKLRHREQINSVWILVFSCCTPLRATWDKTGVEITSEQEPYSDQGYWRVLPSWKSFVIWKLHRHPHSTWQASRIQPS